MPSADPGIDPRPGVPLAPLTTLGVGGAARWFVRATHIEEIAAAHAWCAARGVEMFVLGGGSNLVVADEGFDGLVLQVALSGVRFRQDGGDTVVAAGAGEPWDALVEAAVERRLAGLECLSGIPGTVGGTPIQNVGAYGQDAGQRIEQVTVFDRREASVMAIPAADCGFAYRASRFKGPDAGRFIVCDVVFRLRPGPPTVTYPDVVRDLEAAGGRGAPTLAAVRASVLRIRRRKAMVLDPDDADTRSVGLFFVNPVVTDAECERIAAAAGEPAPGFRAGDRVKIPAAWLIERAGFVKGESDGPVGISSRHTLAIVNRGGATAADVIRLAARIKRRVGERFGVWLRPEPVFVGFGASPEAAFLQGTSFDVHTPD